MILNRPSWRGTSEIKEIVRRLIERKQAEFSGRKVLDTPAGNGDTASLLKGIGAQITACDLYPEYFRYPEIECVKGNLNGDLPFADGSFDWVVCQEGVEHLPNQLHFFQEMNRLLKAGGRLLLTTPNYSNLRTRLSYLLLESEQYKLMPPNEADSIWAADHAVQMDDVYMGHIFFANLTRLRALAALSGMAIREVHGGKANYTSVFLLLFYYPWIWLATRSAAARGLRKNGDTPLRRKAYNELARINLSLNTLTSGHLIVEFEKTHARDEIVPSLTGKVALQDGRT